MRPRRFELIRRFDDYDDVVLCVVVSSRGRSQAIRSIKHHWRNFQKTHPDSDDEFVSYLKHKGYEVEAKRNQPVQVVLD